MSRASHEAAAVSRDAVVSRRGRLIPNPARPGSFLSQALLLEPLKEFSRHINGRVLDVGCGRKPYAPLFTEGVVEHVGCDWPSEELSPDGGHADVFSDAMRLPFADASFDAVVCTEVLEHLPEPRRCVEEIARVTRSNGKVLISVPFIYWIHENPRDYFRFTPHALEYLLSDAGIEIIGIQSRGGLPSIALDLWSKWLMFVTKRVGNRIGMTRPLTAAVGFIVINVHRLFLATRRVVLSTHFLRRVSRSITLADSLSLGYVVLARRIGNDRTSPGLV